MKGKYCKKTGLCLKYPAPVVVVNQGDIIEYSHRNIHRASGEPTAYGGIKGPVEVHEDGLVINAETCTLCIFARHRYDFRSVWLIKNGIEFLYELN